MKGKWKQVIHIYAAESKTHEVKITRSGDTALHVAVSDGQEDIMEQLLEIISREGPVHAEKLLLTKNESGNTPLHIAASMGNMRMCSCIAIVKPSLIGAFNNDRETPFFLTALRGKKEASFAFTKTVNLGKALLIVGEWVARLFYTVGLQQGSKKTEQKHAENPEGSNVALNGKNGKELTPTNEGQHICPSNYTTCIEFVKLIYNTVLKGSNAIMKIREKKEKHKWSVQVMTKLLESTSSMYEYEHTGETPQETQKDDGEETKPYEISDGGDVAAIKDMLESDVQPLTPPNSADSSRSTNTQSTDNQKNSTNRKGGT
ncbi:hypothetical protein FEM48_ZijujUnG0027400 [Ziziphus jujuba var. spinosa]|uniref:Uncharacterized protein n=1 Tax=Ziziphus jujuba var. spinosa TaxID=714518 RepID=A0A978U9M4_ZIZJJ|nr:hypothetical protein FEM48_ZijujUnG0027400 [Ziziphus jujuba var. spinosa]